MDFTIEEIARIIKSKSSPLNTCYISVLLTDSRSLTFPDRTLFFALVTKRNDGHNYITELYDKGVRNFVVSNLPSELMERCSEANWLLVTDTLRALQLLATAKRKQFDIPVIAISGSNGKTTVKEWLYQLLQNEYATVRSPRSYNSQIGVPLSVWQLSPETELGIFEAGISEVNEMHLLEAIIKPTIGILTNVGMAHQEGFNSLQQKCLEKLALYTSTDVIIYDGDNPLIAHCVDMMGMSTREIAWSRTNRERPLYISKVEKHEKSTTIHYSYLRYNKHITIPFISDASIENAIHCLAVLLYLGKMDSGVVEQMQQLKPVAMRMEVKAGRGGCTVIDDTYNSDINSLSIALDFQSRRAGTSGVKRTLILSDIHGSGVKDHLLYKQVAQLLTQIGIDRLVAIGGKLESYKANFDALPEKEFYSNTKRFLDTNDGSSFNNELILIKGAREFGFEYISDMLELKQHETVLEVNLDAVKHNYNYYKSLLNPATLVVCMVKAFGYGAGSYELAKTLQECGCKYIAVAVADEGVELRKAGITMPIMVMNPEATSFCTLFKYNLEPEIYSLRLLQGFINEAEKLGITDYPIHIKIDSGMHRLGFTYSEAEELVKVLKVQPAVSIRSLFSHLAGSDSEALDSFTHQQYELFMRTADLIQTTCTHQLLRHILNTAGISRFPQYQQDMVRLGIGLYGVDSTGVDNKELCNVTTLTTQILQIKELEATDTVGYGRKGMLQRPSRIAAIPIGYADGLDRRLGNGMGCVVVNGVRVPIVGNVCMDVCMIDVTDVPCSVGDRVEVFGTQITVDEIAQKLGTIPYEILTSISDRVKRVYYRE